MGSLAAASPKKFTCVWSKPALQKRKRSFKKVRGQPEISAHFLCCNAHWEKCLQVMSTVDVTHNSRTRQGKGCTY